jgi:nitroreductase
MELRDAIRSTPAVRRFLDEPIEDATVAAILDDARFAPSGGNRQGWRVVLVKDASQRRALRDAYVPAMRDYLAQAAASMTPFSPLNDADAQAAAIAAGDHEPDAFARGLDTVPVLLAVFAELGSLAAVDRELERYSFAGGASIYPFVWSILLAAHERGLGGVMTTVAVRAEPELLARFSAPPGVALASVVALGRPESAPSRLRRRSVSRFASIDRLDGSPLADPD